jgi:hypothetical protein
MTESVNGHGPVVMGADEFRALLATSRRPRRTVPICLRSDLVAQVETLDRELADLVATPSPAGSKDDRMATVATAPGGQRGRELAEQIEALREQMQQSTVDFVVEATSLRQWAELVAAHPPRKGEDGKPDPDDSMGINMLTFWEPAVRACLISPQVDDGLWEMMMGRAKPTADDPDADKRGLSDAQWDLICAAVWAVNRGKVDIPFSSAASRVLTSSAATSKRRGR